MDTNQLEIETELQSQQTPIIKDAIHYYIKMSDAIVNATTQDLKTKHQIDLSKLKTDHEAHCRQLITEHEAHCQQLESDHKAYCQLLDLKYTEQLRDELLKQQLKHEKAMKSQGSTHASLPLVQTLSKTITEREKEINVLNLQIRGLRKQVADAKSPAKIVHLPVLQLSIQPPTPMTVSSIDTPIPVTKLITPSNKSSSELTVSAPEANADETASDDVTAPHDPLSHEVVPEETTPEETTPEETTPEETTPEEETVYVPPAVTTLMKIKFKGSVYYQDKVANETGEQIVYECTNNQPGQIVGRKTKEGKYAF